EARIAVLQSQPVEWRRPSGHNMGRVDPEVSANETPLVNSLTDDETSSPAYRTRLEAEGEGAALSTEDYFSLQHCDSASLSSFMLDTPSLPRKLLAQEDTESLVSTGTLVPEAIYLPPAGHRLVTHSDWDALNAQLSELRGEVSRLHAEKEELERELDTQSNHTHKQVSVLQSQVQASEALLQDLQKSFSQSQNAVQSRLSELSLSQRKMCSELSRLKGEEAEESDVGSAGLKVASLQERFIELCLILQGPHCEERLRIEIVNLREQLDTRTEENVQLSTLRTETEKIQSELLACHTELDALRVALTHLQSTNKTLSNEKAALHQQSLELRSQVISLRSQLDTSQAVQMDFVQLSQSLQVKLELVRQAESLEQVRQILEGDTGPAGSQPADAS
uniref:Rab GTPase-binding effector protein 2 n=1 Tax=Nothobranchius furzeri TaxID=105023 RepID=A0A8C6K9T4_NOTFU